ncbi:hypothetical protein G7Y89_g3347 [Cudoniella acicularis]|uniref:Metalloprotease n=1 Tax=Cudoniella acicularis TaxID=354080 RepID=A0A8H4RTI9_9HELO|nr:hypothetical protein G7Y89_g3347 [Cudoniella acicularis]
MTEETQGEAQPQPGLGESQRQVQQQERQISGSPCLYIPFEILSGLAASNVDSEGQNVMGYSQMAVVPPSFEGDSIKIEPQGKAQYIRPNRLIYDMQFASREEDLPGVLKRSEGDPPLNIKGDPNVDLCYDNFGIAFEFFHKVFGRNSIDGKGGPLIGIVNFGFYFPQATWSVSKANMQHVLVFGNGWDNDPWNHGAPMKTFAGMFGGLVGSLEVVVHEMMHGITQIHVKLLGLKQPGALDEHLSDVFGIMAKQWHKKQTVEQADWLIGEDCLIPEQKGFALRSFANPGTAYEFGSDDFNFRGPAKDPQKSKYTDRFKGSEDRYGVHIDSGIPNKAFYLLAKKLGGYSWEKAGQIWYSALTSNEVPKNCEFRRWARHTVDAAEKDPGFGKSVADKVTEAWMEVGVEPRW